MGNPYANRECRGVRPTVPHFHSRGENRVPTTTGTPGWEAATAARNLSRRARGPAPIGVPAPRPPGPLRGVRRVARRLLRRLYGQRLRRPVTATAAIAVFRRSPSTMIQTPSGDEASDLIAPASIIIEHSNPMLGAFHPESVTLRCPSGTSSLSVCRRRSSSPLV